MHEFLTFHESVGVEISHIFYFHLQWVKHLKWDSIIVALPYQNRVSGEVGGRKEIHREGGNSLWLQLFPGGHPSKY